jgi:hypothetical protein
VRRVHVGQAGEDGADGGGDVLRESAGVSSETTASVPIPTPSSSTRDEQGLSKFNVASSRAMSDPDANAPTTSTRWVVGCSRRGGVRLRWDGEAIS